MRDLTIHLVSDATGSTLQGLAEACLAQFDGIYPVQRLWPLVRSERQLDRMIRDLDADPGPVLYTLIDKKLSGLLQEACARHNLPCMPVMEPIVKGLSDYLGLESRNVPGLQHKMDDSYFRRMDAIDFAMGFDDGQTLDGIETADVILVGVSRTSKTPTCIYLARQGIRAANIPLVPGIPFPPDVLALKKPLFAGLTESPDRLLQLRIARIKLDQKQTATFGNLYIDPEAVQEEVQQATRFFREQGWPIIDVTRRSVEETAAEVMVLLQRRAGRK
jgi:regulator of PEP synthase PpsR (kinase-PPPase family)